MKLQKTRNYGIFTQNEEQRQINETHVRRLASNMSAYGFIPSKPIQCYEKGDALVVVDGHHRLNAAMLAGTSVFYVVESPKAQETMAIENILVKKWGAMDYVRLYALRGKKSYQTLLYYYERGIPITMAASMMINHSASSGNATQSIANGTFTIKTTTIIDRVDRIIQEFKEYNSACKSRAFIAALSKCVMWQKFDCDLFIKRLRENIMMLEKTSNSEQMLSQIESIYNFRSRNPIPLKFGVEDAAKKRGAVWVAKNKTNKAS